MLLENRDSFIFFIHHFVLSKVISFRIYSFKRFLKFQNKKWNKIHQANTHTHTHTPDCKDLVISERLEYKPQ